MNGKVDRKSECDAYWNEEELYEVVKSTMVGTVYYAAVKALVRGLVTDGKDLEPIPEQEQETFGVVMLTSVNSKDYFNFSYKVIDETMGPCDTRCPESILKLLSPTDNEYANNWRKRCHEINMRDKELKKLPMGTEIKVKRGDEETNYIKEKYNGRTLWINWNIRKYVTNSRLLYLDYEIV